ADIDAHGEDRVTAYAIEFIVRRIERTDLARDIALQEAAADDEQQQRNQKALVERHGEVPGGHEDSAEHDSVALPEPTVSDHAAKHRREINEAAIESENLRRQGLRRHPAEHAFDRRAKGGKASDIFNMARQQQLVDH